MHLIYRTCAAFFAVFAVLIAGASISNAQPVELGRLEIEACCPTGVARLGPFVLASYHESADPIRLRIFNYTNASSPTQTSELALTGSAEGIAAESGIAVLAMGAAGLAVVDVSPAATPVQVGSLTLPGEAHDVELVGGIAYVATSSGGLRIVDVSTPSLPVEIGHYDPMTSGTIIDLAVAGSHVAVCIPSTAAGGGNDLVIVDVSNPAVPTASFTQTLGDLMSDWSPGCNHVASNGTLFFVDGGFVDGGGGSNMLEAYSSGGPVGSAPMPGIPFSVDGIAATGSIVHAISSRKLQSYDFSVPASPTLASDVSVGLSPGSVDVEFALTGTRAFITAGLKSIIAIATSNPASPSVLSELIATSTDFLDIELSGDIALVTGGADGLWLIDNGDPALPTQVGELAIGAQDVELAGGLAYVGTHLTLNSALQIVEFSDPSTPTLVGSAAVPSEVRDVAIQGSHAFVVSKLDGLRIIDITNPAAPVEVGVFDPVSIDQSYAAAVKESLVYFGTEAGLRIVDVSDPTLPVEVGSVLGTDHWRLLLSGNLLFAYVGAAGGLRIYDIATPTAPVEIGSVDVDLLISRDMKLVGQRLFLPGDGAYKGITVVDVSDATDPQVEDIWLADVPVSGVAIADGLLFTTERTQGMASYVLPPAAPSVPMFGGAASVGLAGAIAAGAWMRLRIRRHRA